MRPDDLLQLLREKPFQPFRIWLTDGTSFEIRHPELAAVGRSKVFIGRPSAGEALPVFDDWVFVALLHINRIEPLAAAPTSPS
jgi:hypothetical protein